MCNFHILFIIIYILFHISLHARDTWDEGKFLNLEIIATVYRSIESIKYSPKLNIIATRFFFLFFLYVKIKRNTVSRRDRVRVRKCMIKFARETGLRDSVLSSGRIPRGGNSAAVSSYVFKSPSFPSPTPRPPLPLRQLLAAPLVRVLARARAFLLFY